MAKENRQIVKLISSSGSGHFYSTTKNRQNTSKKLTLKKFDPHIRKHVQYTEIK